MRKAWILSLVCAAALLAGGCSNHTDTSSGSQSAAGSSAQPSERTFVCEYSNLAGDTLHQELSDLFQAAGISAQRQENFWSHVEQFNQAMAKEGSLIDASILKDAFAQADILHPGYDAYDMQDQWMAVHPEFNGYNCRITAFTLFGDNLDIAPEGDINDRDLFLDQESIAADPSAMIGSADQTVFNRLFSTIATENTTDPAVHIQKLQADWQARGIRFRDNDRIHLITLWLHNQWSAEENELACGHAGVLIDNGDTLYFVEKLAFQEPYQVVKVASRQELNEYLMAKYDVSWGQDTAAPFVLENSEPLVK